MLIKKVTKLQVTGGHIRVMLFKDILKIEFNRRPYWNYAYYRDCQFASKHGHIGIMLIIEMAKIVFFPAAKFELCYLKRLPN